MDVTPILDPLNDAQREAVTAPAGHLLILAGAGSGKTRVLVHRIAWLLATDQAMPYRVLAVTFTNKAAGEMRGRIEAMLDRPIVTLNTAIQRARDLSAMEAMFDKYGVDTVFAPDGPEGEVTGRYLRERYGAGQDIGSSRLWRVRE